MFVFAFSPSQMVLIWFRRWGCRGGQGGGCGDADRGKPHKRELRETSQEKCGGARSCRGRALRRPWSTGSLGRRKARPLQANRSLKFALMGASPVPTAPVRTPTSPCPMPCGDPSSLIT
jgi:hypothetical protein